MATPLEELGYPLCFEVENAREAGIDAPSKRLNQAQRTRVRSVSETQTEVLVSSTLSRDTWRLATDGGPCMNGTDVAPPPLALLLTGAVSSYMNELLALGMDRGLDLRDVTLVLDNYYALRGSMLEGTAIAMDPRLEAVVGAGVDADEETLQELVETATTTSPVNGLVDGELDNRFKLNGRDLSGTGVTDLDEPLLDDPEGAFADAAHPDERQDPPLVRHTGRKTEPFPEDEEPYTDEEGVDLSEEQDRVIHLRGTCTLREDGVKKVEQRAYSPRGPVFEFLVDEPRGHGGRGRAPDAMSYVTAGIGSCFLTRLGRCAEGLDGELSECRLVQDTHFSLGGSSAATGAPGRAESVETHVFLYTPEDDEFARGALETSERTSFLHALCGTDLDAGVTVTTE